MSNRCSIFDTHAVPRILDARTPDMWNASTALFGPDDPKTIAGRLDHVGWRGRLSYGRSDPLPTLPHAQQERTQETHLCLPTPSIEEVWTSVLNAVPIPPHERQIWLAPTALRALGEDTATISAPNIFVRNRIATHYYDQLAATLSTIVGHPLRINVVTDSSGAGSRR